MLREDRKVWQRLILMNQRWPRRMPRRAHNRFNRKHSLAMINPEG
jgi:hypothetical protein